MIGTALDAAVVSVLLAVSGGQGETSCRPIGELKPRVSAGEIEAVASPLAATPALWRWSAEAGDTLYLKVRTADAGTYEIAVRAATGTNGPAFSARVWELPLTRVVPASRPERDTPPDRHTDIRFDPIPMGPGHHVLELQRLEPGELQLECVRLRRTGDAPPHLGQPSEDPGERAFLGVQLGPAQPGGVTIRRTVEETAAAEAGIEAGDVLVKIDGERISGIEDAQDTIASYRPGDLVELELLREGERITMTVALGRRPPQQRVARAEHVIGVLQVRPGQVIADIGCGAGWLAEAIAEEVGPEGTVYAVEIQERLVGRLHRWSPANVVPVLSAPDDVSLPENCLDTAMLHDVASHIARKGRPRFYESLDRALKPEGRLVIFGPHGKAKAMLRELRGYGYVAVDDEALTALSSKDLDQRLSDGIVFRRQ